jgi:phosphoglucomutase/phosphomannomutase
LTITEAGAAPRPFNGPQGDMVILDLASDGNYIACRPSGTESKIKFYMFAYAPPEQLANLESAQAELSQRLDAIEVDLRKFAGV